MEVIITTYGGIVISLKAPDRNGALADVVLGFDTLDEYLASTRYFGVIAGRLRTGSLKVGSLWTEWLSAWNRTEARTTFMAVQWL